MTNQAESSRHGSDSVLMGDRLRIRPIHPSDWEALCRFHRSLSMETIEGRFHGAKPNLSEPLAHRFTELDGRTAAALVAVTSDDEQIVGVARYAMTSPGVAEAAFVVQDAYQGKHIGSRLMRALRTRALDNGISKFVAEVMPGNIAMLRLLAEAGPCKTHYLYGVCEVFVDLGPRSRGETVDDPTVRNHQRTHAS